MLLYENFRYDNISYKPPFYCKTRIAVGRRKSIFCVLYANITLKINIATYQIA